MKNYAIILGVSEYINADNLPACKNDVNRMFEILNATEKYQILLIDEKHKKQEIIKEVEDYFNANNAEEEIGEIFFYFSGHGYQDKDDLHFILRETELDKINATSFNNAELDDIVRKKNPRLYVKIIDACQSGFAYIKSLNYENKVVFPQKESDINIEKKLENCIFMYSSKKDESSIANEEYSIFTQAFINAVLEGSKEESVRY